MQELIQFAQSQSVRKVVEWATKQSMVQGVVAEYRPIWFKLFGDELLTSEERRDLWHRSDRLPYPYDLCCGYGFDDECRRGTPVAIVAERWKRLFGNLERYQLRICLLPSSGQDSQSLPELLETSLTVVFEERPISRLSTGVGLRTTAGSTEGTIGGLVRSSLNDEWLGVTCSHAVPYGASVAITDESGGYRTFFHRMMQASPELQVEGHCIRRTELIELSPNSTCNPYGQLDTSNEVDIALVGAEFSSLTSSSIERYDRPVALKASATSHQHATMLAADDRRDVRIGGLAIYYTLAGPSSDPLNTPTYCFKNLFEVLAAPYAPKPVNFGDSGSWIMRPGQSGDEWYGVVLGSDDLRGFAMFAETVDAWINNEALVDV